MAVPGKNWQNIGPTSRQWLADIGITDPMQVREIGAVETFVRLKQVNPKVSLNMLWALHAMLHNIHWTDISTDEKDQLRQFVADRMGSN